MTDLLPTWRIWLGYVACVVAPFLVYALLLVVERLSRGPSTITITCDDGTTHEQSAI